MSTQVEGTTDLRAPTLGEMRRNGQTPTTPTPPAPVRQRHALQLRWLACLVQCLAILGLSVGLTAGPQLTITQSPVFVDINTGNFDAFIARSLDEHQSKISNVVKKVHDAGAGSANRVIALRLQDAHVSYGKLRSAQQQTVRRLAGKDDPAAWYEKRIAKFLEQIVTQSKQGQSGLRVAVVGLPVESKGSASAAAETNRRYGKVIDLLDVFVTTRQMILSGGTVNEMSTLKSSLPEAFRLAKGRSIVFRTNNHWRMVNTADQSQAPATPTPNTSGGQPTLPPELQSLYESTGGTGPVAELLLDWGAGDSPYDYVSSSTFQPPPDGKVDGADLSYLLGNLATLFPAENGSGDDDDDTPPTPPPPPPPPPSTPSVPPGQVGAFTTLGTQYVIGSGVNVPFTVSPNATNVDNVVFQVWSFVTHSIEAPAPDYTAPFVYPGSALANVTPGPGQIQAVVRTSTDELIAVITHDVQFVSSTPTLPPPNGDGNPDTPPPTDGGSNPTPPSPPPGDGDANPQPGGDDTTNPPPPPSDPPGTIDGSPMGINLSDIQYYSPEWPFKNFFKTSMGWRDGSWNPSVPVALTSDGYPLLNPGQTAVSLICRDIGGAYPTGPWVLLYDGSGTVSVGGNAQMTGSSPGRITFQVTNPTNEGIHVYVNATNNANPVRNIRVMPAEFEGNYESQPFHPTFLDRLQHFSVLRFMDWMKTNNSTQQNWSDRPTVNYATYAAKGAPVQVMVQLANTTGASPWFCMPHLASDDYVRKFAEYVRDNLNPELKAYVELSNECWNSMFQQTAYFQAQGQAQGLAGEPYLCVLRAYSKRAAQVMDIWADVFQGQQHRLVRVLAGHAENPWANEQIITYNNAYQHADALAVAPYFGGWLGNSGGTVNMTVDQILDAAEANIAQQKTYSQQNFAKASQYGLELIAYEGGQHLVGVGGYVSNDALTQKFIAANRSTRMGQLYLKDLQNWTEVGGGVFCAYSFCGRYSQWGSWGLLEQQNQNITAAPKFAAVVQHVQSYIQAHQQSQGGN